MTSTSSIMLLFSVPLFLSLLEDAWGSHRILGGDLTPITDCPYQLSLRLRNKHICGAAILSPTIALTAAHCVEDGGPLSIVAGSTLLNDTNANSQTRHIKRALFHPQYDTDYFDYDIALLFLAEPLTFSENINKVALPKSGSLHEGMMGLVSGWGYFDPKGLPPDSDTLRAVLVPVWNQTKCENAYDEINQIRPSMFCAGWDQGGKDGCQGDSGGPLVIEGVLYGVVSFGYGCGKPGYPGVYANVSLCRDFIKQYADL